MAIRVNGGPSEQVMGKVPPHNLEAEESVLGACLLSREAIATALEILKPTDFYRPAHQEVFNAILELYGRGEPVDSVTVSEELRRRGSLERLGGKPFIFTLVQSVPTPGSAEHYARIVEEHSLLRRLIDASHQINDIAFGVPEDVEGAIDQAEDLIYQVSQRRDAQNFSALKDLLAENMELVEKLYERGSSITGLPTGFADFDNITAGLQPSNLIVVAARPAMGKCISADCLIDLPGTGERVRMGDLVARRHPRVANLSSEWALQETQVSDWIDNGIRECFKVTTRSGRTLEATANHPFLTVDGWRELQDLAAGANVAVPRRLPIFGQERWTPERTRLLAYYIAEGSCTKTVPGFTNTDPVIVDDFADCVAAEFPQCRIRRERMTSYASRPPGARSGRNPLTAWLDDLGVMGKKADAKSFPDAVWRFDRGTLSEFLRVLFSCAGTIYPMAGYPRIEFCVASETLARDVHHALVRFGVVARIRRKTERAWNITITDPTSVNAFQREIGWIGEKASRFPDELPDRRSNLDKAPAGTWRLVRSAASARGLSLSEVARLGVDQLGKGWNPHTRQGIGLARVRAYGEVLDHPGLKMVASPDIYWDEIVAITPVGPKQVYDITVPDGSNFVVEDIFVHNSALAVTMAQHIAIEERAPVVIFSLEMSKMELVQRLMCAEARVDSNRLRRGALQDSDWPKLSHALGRLAEAPIFIDDTANVTIMEMRAKCRRLKAKHGLGLVIVDYLQLMQPHPGRRNDNRVQEVAEISRSLKILARELEVPVIAVSQLSRNVEHRTDKRPLLADLRESGSIEQDADLVVFIYRDEVYNPDTTSKGIAEIHIAKHRNGPIGKVELAFLDHYTKFANLARGV